MIQRFGYLALIAVALASESGCCCSDCWPCGKTWCGPQCGEFYWHEWFSHKPDCCDPCDQCGNYTGEVKQSAYSNGAARSTRPVPAAAEPRQEYYPEPAEPELADPIPTEELPPAEPSAAVETNEFGQVISYEKPVDSPSPARKLGRPRRANDFAR